MGIQTNLGGGSFNSFPMMKHIKNNYSLIPLVAALGIGIAFATFHSARQLIKSPDVVVSRRGNPTPYEKLYKEDGTAVQYKYYSTVDYSKLPKKDQKLSDLRF